MAFWSASFIVCTLVILNVASARADDCTYLQSGIASVYSARFDGRATASGDTMRMDSHTAAHPTLKYGTRVKVVDVKTKKATFVVINDKGPHIKHRILDLAGAPAKEIGFPSGRHGLTGIKRVKLYVCN